MNIHGKVLISWEGSILIIKFKGPFNDEGTLDALDAIEKSVSTKNLAIWYRLAIWDDETLGSPSTIKLIKERTHEWDLEKHCKKIAVVVCNSLQQSIVENLFGSSAKIFRIEVNQFVINALIQHLSISKVSHYGRLSILRG